MMFLLLVITLVFDLGNFALIPVTKQDNSVRSCIKRIIDVYADNATTVLSIYGDFTRGNFLPHPMQVPMINIDVNQKVYNLNYQPRRELVIIDPFGYDFDEIRILGFWNDADLSKRKFVFVIDVISRPILDLLRYLWRIDIIDIIFLVNKSRSSFTEVVVGNKFHPSNKCGSVVATMLASSCDRIKNRKQKFFRNYRRMEGIMAGSSHLKNYSRSYNYKLIKMDISETLALSKIDSLVSKKLCLDRETTSRANEVERNGEVNCNFGCDNNPAVNVPTQEFNTNTYHLNKPMFFI
ncbi:hypothetical protein FQA39_LY12514 [Lamprigera yunnana]|nr:hypothetical protein FQA39_LY12514 [Lamprigera yunnana]